MKKKSRWIAQLRFVLLMTCSTVAQCDIVADPEEGGFGGTGHRPDARPERMERPEMPERIEQIERIESIERPELDQIESDILVTPARPDVETMTPDSMLDQP